MGFFAIFDAKTKKEVRKYAYHNDRAVDRIQVGGGYLWAQYDRHLYRVDSWRHTHDVISAVAIEDDGYMEC